MPTTDADRIARVRKAIADTKIGLQEARAHMADSLLKGEWQDSFEVDRLLGAQARTWVYAQVETVLTHCEEDPAYTLPGTVARMRDHLLRLLTAQSAGGSSSDTHNAQEHAKLRALQTIITTGPLAY